jgi:hypothetical protein
VEPFTVALGAISAIKSGIALYKEAKAVGKDLAAIRQDMVSALGSLFDAHEQVKVEAEKQKSAPKSKTKSLQSEALERVFQAMELERQATELREMLIYEVDASFGAVWSKFQAECAVLARERAEEAEREKKPHGLRSSAASDSSKSGSCASPGAFQAWWSWLSLWPLCLACTWTIRSAGAWISGTATSSIAVGRIKKPRPAGWCFSPPACCLGIV